MANDNNVLNQWSDTVQQQAQNEQDRLQQTQDTINQNVQQTRQALEIEKQSQEDGIDDTVNSDVDR